MFKFEGMEKINQILKKKKEEKIKESTGCVEMTNKMLEKN